MSFSIILPTLNESGHIIDLIDQISDIFKKKKNIFEIIVVDDNSTDKTANLVNEYQKKNLFTKLIVRKSKKRNLASSINEGIALSKFENIIWLDADFQHPPKYLEDFIKYSNKNDIIIASRFLKNSNRYFQDDKFKKKTNENQSYIYNKICNYLFFDDVTDYTSGFICVKKKCFDNFTLNGFYGDYFLDLIINLKKNNYKILEIPYKDAERATGFSKTVVKINFKYIYICFRYMLTLLKIFFKNKFNFD
tara:strand:+ start:3006 stop:3752 length:747 start_codon:yes stop_codon:yes gene_type:complete